MSDPLVSVIIPNYNLEKFVGQAIESALAQTYPAVEVVVVDDGSTDNSRAVLDRYVQQAPDRVRVIYQANGGVALARMRAIEDTRGEFIVPLDSDDYLHPEAIAVWMQYRSEHPQYVVIYSGFYRVDTENTVLYEVLPHQQRNEPVEGNILATLLNGNTVTASTSLIERARLLEVGGYVSKATLHNGRGHDDYFLMLRLAAAGYAFGYVARPLLYYRDTPNSISKDTIPFVANRQASLAVVFQEYPQSTVAAFEEGLHRRNAQLEAMHQQLLKTLELSDAREKAVAEQFKATDAAIAEREQYFASLNAQMNAAAAEREQYFANLNTQMNVAAAEREQQFAAQNAQMNAAAAEREQKLADIHAQVTQQNDQLNQRDQLIAQLQGEIELLNSIPTVQLVQKYVRPTLRKLRK